MTTALKFADVVESADRLSPDEQEALIEIIRRRLAARRRERLSGEVEEARAVYGRGEARPASAANVMDEILG